VANRSIETLTFSSIKVVDVLFRVVANVIFPSGAVDIFLEIGNRIYLDRALIFRLLRFSLKNKRTTLK
jgi:hypothetical protein